MVATLNAKALGQRIRQMRTRRGLTQQDLAGDDYSKSYISAIEQGKTRPSLEALQRIASRLEIPAGNLLDPNAPGFTPFDAESMPRRVRRRRGVRAGAAPSLNDPAYIDLRLSEAERAFYTGSPAQSLEILRKLLPDETGASQAPRPLDANQLERGYFIAAQAAVRTGAATEALGFLQRGMPVAQRQGDTEMYERMRNVLGLAYYHADQPLSALEQHRLCLDAVQSGNVGDPTFRLSVLSNIANDYWALHDDDRALNIYKSALELVSEVNSIEKQAAIFWGAAMRHTENGTLALANHNATRALSLYEAMDNIGIVSQIESTYGDILLDMGDDTGAESYLTRSIEQPDSLNSDADKANVLTNLARVSVKRGDLGGARERIEQAIKLARAETEDAGAMSHNGAGRKRVKANRVMARALALAGEVYNGLKDEKAADNYFDEAIKVVESGEPNEETSQIYQRYAQVLAGRGNHEQASKFYERAYKAVTKRI